MVVGVSCSKHQQTYIDKKLGLTNKLSTDFQPQQKTNNLVGRERERREKEQILGLKSL